MRIAVWDAPHEDNESDVAIFEAMLRQDHDGDIVLPWSKDSQSRERGVQPGRVERVDDDSEAPRQKRAVVRSSSTASRLTMFSAVRETSSV